jgi:hypothetical protein
MEADDNDSRNDSLQGIDSGDDDDDDDNDNDGDE